MEENRTYAYVGRVVPLWRGLYSAETEYQLNHIVQHENGSVYWHKGKDATTGVNPTDENVWAKIVDAGEITKYVDTAETAKEGALEAQKRATSAQSAAETAAKTAETAKTAAETAKADATTAKDAAQTSKESAELSARNAETSATAAEAAKNGMIYVSFTVNAEGHLIAKNAEVLGTTSFRLNQNGHMEVMI